MSELAIIIPAYKDAYLDQTLCSLAGQTDKDFTVYIGDDCSPFPLESIVDKYRGKLEIVYERFPDNRGGTDLVAQWERCLALMGDEEFFCLFSDDDVMQPACVERLREAWKCHPGFDVYHFDLDIMDAGGQLKQHCAAFPLTMSADSFIHELYSYRIDARMPEFVFRTRKFREAGGFVRFDLAYRSDNATVLAVAKDKGICTVQGARVVWRDSGVNVSSSQNPALRLRRVVASISFFNWMESYYALRHEPCALTKEHRRRQLLAELEALSDCTPLSDLLSLLRRIHILRRNPYLYVRSLLHLRKRYKQRRK